MEQLRYAACLPDDDKKLIDPCISDMAPAGLAVAPQTCSDHMVTFRELTALS